MCLIKFSACKDRFFNYFFLLLGLELKQKRLNTHTSHLLLLVKNYQLLTSAHNPAVFQKEHFVARFVVEHIAHRPI